MSEKKSPSQTELGSDRMATSGSDRWGMGGEDGAVCLYPASFLRNSALNLLCGNFVSLRPARNHKNGKMSFDLGTHTFSLLVVPT